MKRLNANRVLNALKQGLTVTVEGHQLCMTDEDEIVIRAESHTINDDGTQTPLPDRYLPLEVSVNDFIRLCNNMSAEENFTLSANVTLASMKGK